ncbi:hypothetical protein KUF71_011090 [Frankliniella fusca]|uniref:Uncharacterized protein n=1 Tax=Frankliniella fusca TaxID=407009 RepID=A0AAE1HIP4_9NEOP|nr:hypothetical protein KUF71_011090 [Frankliniella fusca]
MCDNKSKVSVTLKMSNAKFDDLIQRYCNSMVTAVDVNDLKLANKSAKVLSNLVIANALTLGSQFKIELIQTLAPLLRHVRLILHSEISLAENIASMIEALVEDCHQLPMETGLALIRYIAITINKDEDVFSDYKNILFGILINLIASNKIYQDIFPSNTIELFLNKLFENDSQHIKWNVVNVIILLTKHPQNKENQISIFKHIVPSVVRKLREWVENPSTGDFHFLKDLLFLCREIMSGSAPCQDIFFKNEGFDVLARLLEATELMTEIMDIPLDRPFFPDIANTLFSSILCLLETAVFKSRKVCKKVHDLQLLSLLKEYIFITPTDQQGILVSCIVHILKCGANSPDSKMFSEIYDIANTLKDKEDMFITSDVLAFLSKEFQRSIAKKPLQKLGTPHPRLFKKATARKASPTNHSQATAVEPSVIERSYLFSKAELIELLKCVKIYGNNMKAIRKVFPFHKELKEQDLYAVWKTIWKTN